MAKALAEFIREASVIREYSEVHWAAKRYRILFAVSPLVEVCSAIACAGLGDAEGASVVLGELHQHRCTWGDIATIAGDVLGQDFRPREQTSASVLAAILEAVGPKRQPQFHPMHGN